MSADQSPSVLSSFLRASGNGQKPTPPPEVLATQRKYGFGGKLPKATMLTLLAAFALSALTPHAEAATQTQVRAVEGMGAGAVVGAIIGNNSGGKNGGKGAVVGAASGLILGAIFGQHETIKKQERTINAQGQAIDEQGRVIDEQGRVIEDLRRNQAIPVVDRHELERREAQAQVRAEAIRAEEQLSNIRRQMDSAEQERAVAQRAIAAYTTRLELLAQQEELVAAQVRELEARIAGPGRSESLTMHSVTPPQVARERVVLVDRYSPDVGGR